jgi:CRISPR/Cas system CSM-associated protein Csm3 (group 7 of RAMP superfamily)
MTTAGLLPAQPQPHRHPPLSRGAYRLEITCPVDLLGPLHVGTGERLSILSDAPVFRLPDGTVVLPPSSVRGVLRDWCEREAPLLGVTAEAVSRLFGATPDERQAEADERARRRGEEADPRRIRDRQGRLTIPQVRLHGAVATGDVRDHVRIDRRWGTAAHGAKFDQEVVHCATAEIVLVYEGDAGTDEEVRLLRSAVAALERGLLAFGGKTGWGFGWARQPAGDASRTIWRQCQRSDPAERGAYLRSRLPGGGADCGSTITPPAPAAAPVRAGERAPRPWSWLWLELELQFDGPMLVGGPDRREPAAGERAPDAVYFATNADTVVLPGSSLRGALHSHADRIAATLGCPEVAECLFGTVERQGLLRVGEGRHVGPRDRDGRPALVWMDHVAIDRVTGFAADQRLFNARALASPCFAVPLLVRWHAADDATKQAVALLLCTLRDAAAGVLWVGSRTTRGYGHLAAIHLAGGALSAVRSQPTAPGLFARADEQPIDAGELGALAAFAPIAELFDTWRTLVAARREEDRA